ncbi:ABC transporter ATP-binding protein [Arcobacter sp. 15-2]|uniref:ATP-binding cassette domain-containing protein n=1 Tax=Arcobacter sp. 15-2 TaxID=3374109 RepID=UPI00399C90A0
MLKISNYNSDILHDISFTLENKNLIILGSNGAGKTTLAKVLSGVTKSSCVTIDDKNPATVYGEKRTQLINYIPPKLEMYDEFMSVEEFLKLNQLYSDISINEVLKLVNCGYIKDKKCKTLSSGEAQLLLLSSAILHNAKYTIFDEPTSNLDPQKIKNSFQVLEDNTILQNKIIITHNLNLAYKLKYDILYIKDHKIVFYDTNEKFFDEQNLQFFFEDSVKKCDDNIVVNI